MFIEASSNGDDEDLEHTLDDSANQLGSTVGLLKEMVMMNLSASVDTAIDLKMLGIQVIAGKMTLISSA